MAKGTQHIRITNGAWIIFFFSLLFELVTFIATVTISISISNQKYTNKHIKTADCTNCHLTLSTNRNSTEWYLFISKSWYNNSFPTYFFLSLNIITFFSPCLKAKYFRQPPQSMKRMKNTIKLINSFHWNSQYSLKTLHYPLKDIEAVHFQLHF